MTGRGRDRVLTVFVMEKFGLRGKVIKVVGRIGHGTEYFDDAVEFYGVPEVSVTFADSVLEVEAGRLRKAVARRSTAPLT